MRLGFVVSLLLCTGMVPIGMVLFFGQNDWGGQRRLLVSSLRGVTHGEEAKEKLAVVITWVNVSDQRHQTLQQRDTKRTEDHHRRFLELDEVRYCIRSIEEHLNGFSSLVLVSTDFPCETTKKLSGDDVEAQIPVWWNPGMCAGKGSVVPPSTIFKNASHLPTFNSLAIEVNFWNLPLAADKFVYFNDDMFLGAHMSADDFFHSSLGYVLRLEDHLATSIRHKKTKQTGEWRSIHHSNVLLTQRFGERKRVYIAHFPRIFGLSILKEIATLWPQEHLLTSSHRFRGSFSDIHIAFLFAHYLLEKAREEMLRSYFVYKVDKNLDSVWSYEERMEAVQDLVPSAPLPTGMVPRSSTSGRTNFTWDSSLGYPFVKRQPNDDFFYKANILDRTCFFNVSQACLGDEWFTESIRMPVELGVVLSRDVACGDCILSILLAGSKKLSAVLPPESSPMFAVALAAISRYRYTLGTSHSRFIRFNSQENLSRSLTSFKKRVPTLVCINNDFPADGPKIASTKALLQSFLGTLFARPSTCEIR